MKGILHKIPVGQNFGEFAGHSGLVTGCGVIAEPAGGFPSQGASNAEIFCCCLPEETVEQTVKMPMI